MYKTEWARARPGPMGRARPAGPGPGPGWARAGPARARPRLRRGSKFPDSSTIGENFFQENALFFGHAPFQIRHI